MLTVGIPGVFLICSWLAHEYLRDANRYLACRIDDLEYT
jgi:hypothetical protein